MCGRPVGPSHEKYARYRYCSIECHKKARRINAAENRKRKSMRRVTVDAVVPADHKCRVCNKQSPDVAFTRDNSRSVPFALLCTSCERKKTAEYYQSNRDRIKAKSLERNRETRAKSQPNPVTGIDLSPGQLLRATNNLAAIRRELPESAVVAIIAALDAGRINGMLFEDKSGCGCLWGTAGRACGWGISEEGAWARKYRQRWCAEIDLFGHIAPGDTPHTNPYSRICRDILTQE